ncbi:spindlin-3-like [Patiria miniata]|uniref:Uncharacterized protein n=1 Tax=Patiria miniata TaxID=46514 RepID=A0A914AIE6_PATMI|nr:spindlin-3-like [Patiria miniata]
MERLEEEPSGTTRLVNKRVHHRFETDQGTKWWRGKVISQVRGFPSWFNIAYEESPDTVYTYQLLEDLEAGDLVIEEEH